MSTDLAARVNIDPVAVIAAETAAGPGDKGLFTKLLDSIPSIYPKVNEDPFGASASPHAELNQLVPVCQSVGVVGQSHMHCKHEHCDQNSLHDAALA